MSWSSVYRDEMSSSAQAQYAVKPGLVSHDFMKLVLKLVRKLWWNCSLAACTNEHPQSDTASAIAGTAERWLFIATPSYHA